MTTEKISFDQIWNKEVIVQEEDYPKYLDELTVWMKSDLQNDAYKLLGIKKKILMSIVELINLENEFEDKVKDKVSKWNLEIEDFSYIDAIPFKDIFTQEEYELQKEIYTIVMDDNVDFEIGYHGHASEFIRNNIIDNKAKK